MLNTKKRTECTWDELAELGSACKGKKLQFVECEEPTDKWKMKDEYRFHVMEIEYTWMGYKKKFDSRDEYIDYCKEKRILRREYNALDELKEPFLMKRQREWIAKARVFHNRWSHDYVPEDLRCAINAVLATSHDPPCQLQWHPFTRQEINAEELPKGLRLWKGEFIPWNGENANKNPVGLGMTDHYLSWMV
jgi:hypothetical protein